MIRLNLSNKTNKALTGNWGTGENGHLFQGNNSLILRKTKTILGNRVNKKTNFRGTKELDNLFQGNKGTGTFLGASLIQCRFDDRLFAQYCRLLMAL